MKPAFAAALMAVTVPGVVHQHSPHRLRSNGEKMVKQTRYIGACGVIHARQDMHFRNLWQTLSPSTCNTAPCEPAFSRDTAAQPSHPHQVCSALRLYAALENTQFPRIGICGKKTADYA